MYFLLLAAPLVWLAQDASMTADMKFLAPQLRLGVRRSVLVSSPTLQRLLELTNEQKANVALLLQKVTVERKPLDKWSPPKIDFDHDRFNVTFDDNDAALEGLLTPDQLRTVGQVQLQLLGKQAVFRLSALSKHLHVTEEQTRKAVEMRTALAKSKGPNDDPSGLQFELFAILDAEQRRRAETLFGEERPVGRIDSELRRRWEAKRNELKTLILSLGSNMDPFRLLFSDELLEEMQVTAAQRKQLVAFVEREREFCRKLVGDRNSTSDHTVMRKAFDLATTGRKQRVAEIWRELDAILKPAQTARLNEAWLQFRGLSEVYAGASDAYYKLKITKAQTEALKVFWKEQAETDRKVRESGKSNSEQFAHLGKSIRDSKKKMHDLLTEEQRVEWKKMLGAPLPPHVLESVKRTQQGSLGDEFGFPRMGIGLE